MNDPVIRWQHTPQFEAGSPVFPESPVLPSPFLLHGMRGWHWQVATCRLERRLVQQERRWQDALWDRGKLEVTSCGSSRA
jgi:hypothetical protein